MAGVKPLDLGVTACDWMLGGVLMGVVDAACAYTDQTRGGCGKCVGPSRIGAGPASHGGSG